MTNIKTKMIKETVSKHLPAVFHRLAVEPSVILLQLHWCRSCCGNVLRSRGRWCIPRSLYTFYIIDDHITTGLAGMDTGTSKSYTSSWM